MKTILINSQEHFDNLENFTETTILKVLGGIHLTVKKVPEKCTLRFYGNSRGLFYNNSSGLMYQSSIARNFSDLTKIKAYDNAVVFEHEKSNIELFNKAKVINEFYNTSFDEWLERGMVYADDIFRKLVSSKTIGNVTIYETDKGYVARNKDKFSHGETVEKAVSDLRYKIGDRDTSKYKSWKIEDIKPIDEIIESYRVITGACEMGVREFCNRLNLKENYSINEIFEITQGQYGANKYREFFE